MQLNNTIFAIRYIFLKNNVKIVLFSLKMEVLVLLNRRKINN